MAAEAARLRDMHPSDVADIVRALPLAQRRQLAEAMDDERLADLLEELPEAEQLRIIEGLDLDRLVDVLDEMEYDDLADLLAEMPGEQRTRILEAMDADDADVVRRLLSYEEGTAGGMMTPGASSSSAPRRRWPTPSPRSAIRTGWCRIAAQVFVVPAAVQGRRPARYLGVVHFQRLLREPPSMELGRLRRAGADDRARRHRARGRRAAGAATTCSPSRVCRRAGQPARRDHRRRRARPHAGRPVGASATATPTRRDQRPSQDGCRDMVKRREDLTTPRASRRLGVHYDPDAFGRFSESIARFLGTARFLVFQTVIIVVWILLNVTCPTCCAFDPWDRGFVLLTLVLSLQAAYAAPLILLAQNRQEDRDRVQAETDRELAERTQADTEFLAREIASVRADARRRGHRRGAARPARRADGVGACPRRRRPRRRGGRRSHRRRVTIRQDGIPVNDCRRTPWRVTWSSASRVGTSASLVVITPPAGRRRPRARSPSPRRPPRWRCPPARRCRGSAPPVRRRSGSRGPPPAGPRSRPRRGAG